MVRVSCICIKIHMKYICMYMYSSSIFLSKSSLICRNLRLKDTNHVYANIPTHHIHRCGGMIRSIIIRIFSFANQAKYPNSTPCGSQITTNSYLHIKGSWAFAINYIEADNKYYSYVKLHNPWQVSEAVRWPQKRPI